LKWLSDIRKNSSVTRARKVTSLKEFYNYLYKKKGLLKSNPISGLETASLKKTLPKYLTLEESMQLLKSIETKNTERDYCIITLFLNCGMRLSELCGLDINDVSIEERTIRLLGKGGKERIVYLNQACTDALKDYFNVRNTIGTQSVALFLSSRKKRISRRRVEEIIEECLQKASLSNTGVSVHKLRHTAATLMYQYGNVDTLVIKDVLGHKSIATTEIYTHLSNEKVKEAMNANPLSKVIQKSDKKNN